MKKSRNYNCIKSVLAIKGISNKELAEGLKTYDTTVSAWCRNVKQPNYENLLAIAEFLNVEMGDLLTKRKDLREIEIK
ncbi:helix-turn-helix domain-containing protein [Fontibacter flavus]|uniref:Helix-turn-helix domain-containing protein n=1 Tax=Fontibacter flavus TaxID=654838 RepID=A0ABV6FWX6_9BACT